MSTHTDGLAVITGAASGIGAATARAFVAEGYRDLVLTDLNSEPLESIADDLRASGAQVITLAGDVADPALPGRVVEALADKAVQVLVHSAGLSPSMADPQRILEVNLDASARLVDALEGRVAEGGVFVLVASNSSYFPMPPEAAAAFREPLPPEGSAALLRFAPSSQVAYPLSKLGVRTIARVKAKAFAQRGARIVSVSPGAIETPMTAVEVPASEPAQGMIAASPIGRMGTPEEVAAVIVFLASPQASFVTSVDWLVDGGQTAALGF